MWLLGRAEDFFCFAPQDFWVWGVFYARVPPREASHFLIFLRSRSRQYILRQWGLYGLRARVGAMYLVCARTETRRAGHGEGRTEHSTESLIAFPFPITMLISLPYFGPLVVNKPAQKILCRCCSWSCAILPQMAERGAGRRRRPEIVHALRISPPNYRPGLPFIAEPPPPSGIRRFRGAHLRFGCSSRMV